MSTAREIGCNGGITLDRIDLSEMTEVARLAMELEQSRFLSELEANKPDLTFVSLSSPPSTNFDEIIKSMDSIHPLNLVHKLTLKSGFGPKIKKDQKVLVQYEMYIENVVEPFDSTVLRDKPAIFDPEYGVIEGLEFAILSMNVKEISKFIFNWKCAFGEHGCLPRIPRKANICCFVEIIKIIESPQIKQGNELAAVEGTYATIVKDVEVMLEHGKALFVNRKYDDSIIKMKDAIHLLESISLNSDEEQINMNILYVRLNVNLAAIYNHINKPELACIHCQNALRINPQHEKALFNYGRANIRLNNFSSARKHLIKAIKLNPNDETFARELRRLTEKERDVAVRNQALADNNKLSN